MFELKNYVAAASLAEADALLHADRRHVILGGLLWMRLGRSSYDTGIDLSRLGLDTIRGTAAASGGWRWGPGLPGPVFLMA